MMKFTIPGMAAILSTTLVTPVLAQAVIQQPSAPSQKRILLDRGVADAMALAPPSRFLAPGNETTTRPWSAPTGHRQPGIADVPASTSASQQILDQEDANVNRIIRGVCRGC